MSDATAAASSCIFVVDDDARFRAAVTRMLKASGFTVEAFASASELLERLRSEAVPAGCVLADLDMPGLDGLELQAALAASPEPLPVVFLTGKGDVPSSVRAMRQGAEDFLTKLAPQEELLAAVRRALARDAHERGQRVRLRTLKERFARLTPREHEVLGHVLTGALNKQIAADLGIDERSVKRHRTSFMGKLKVESVVALADLARAAGWRHGAEGGADG